MNSTFAQQLGEICIRRKENFLIGTQIILFRFIEDYSSCKFLY